MIALLCLTIFSGFAQAQEQEKKLVDRLLRPDMSLANSAQNKQFVAAEGTFVDRKFEAKTFYAVDQHLAKPFGGLKDFFARAFGTRKFLQSNAAAETKANAKKAFANTQFPTSESSLVRTSNEASKKAEVHEYAENKPFLAQGTRQKILSQQDHPLTIDEIRELLNKN
ncbi:MAG TPA: hypothetical protein VH207_08950 [Chthoniobacterales bacterium]|jgi:hypothetical protein|nr:hypothetical protein [Chthoniobacterales bacterium]